ncbi:hypothetical protein [Roseovarius ramblicola]|uniref:Uncharacterized protein n=1 Tax=Roseovarius ramblicola TaxID=2022336 RepID=A0ABV5I458_9RHOB
MTMTMLTTSIMVLFGALLAGKMLMEIFPNSGFRTRRDDAANDQTPAE